MNANDHKSEQTVTQREVVVALTIGLAAFLLCDTFVTVLEATGELVAWVDFSLSIAAPSVVLAIALWVIHHKNARVIPHAAGRWLSAYPWAPLLAAVLASSVAISTGEQVLFWIAGESAIIAALLFAYRRRIRSRRSTGDEEQ